MDTIGSNTPEPRQMHQGVDRGLQDGDDQALIDRIHQNLGRLGYVQLQNIKCFRDGDEIVLTGSLDSFYLKQVALSVAMKLPGVNNVRNEIMVN